MRLPDRVPLLRGWSWRIFVAVWSLLLIVQAAATVMAFITFKPWETHSAEQMIGLRLARGHNNASVIVEQTIGDEAHRAGIVKGDTVLSIDGQDPALRFSGRERQLDGPVGTGISIETRSLAGVPAVHRLTRDPEHYRQAAKAAWLSPGGVAAFDFLFTFGSDMAIMFAAIILMVRRARDPLAPWVSLALILVGVGNSQGGGWLRLQGDTFLQMQQWCQIGGVSLVALTLGLFPNAEFRPRASWILPPLVVAMAIVWRLFDNWTVGNSALLTVLIVAVALVAMRYRAMSPGVGRQQIRWALLGFGGGCAAYLVFLVFQAMEPAAPNYTAFLWTHLGVLTFLNLGTLLLVAFMTISLMRYRLYDADAAISRSVALGALTLSLLAVFAASEKLIELFGEEYFGKSMGTLAGGLAAAMAAVLLTPLHHRITHWAEHRFQSAMVHLRHNLPLLVADMRENASPEAIADAVLARIKTGVRASHCAIVDSDGPMSVREIGKDAVMKWMAGWDAPAEDYHGLDLDRADPLFPVRVPLQVDGLTGRFWLLIGPRPDGSFYGREERDTLTEIADPIARALAIATQRQGREREIERAMCTMADKIVTLQRRFDTIGSAVGDQI